MSTTSRIHAAPTLCRWGIALVLGVGVLVSQSALATTPLADQPVFTNTKVPGNLTLALSVEFPTAISVAHVNNTYSGAETYLGYFDPNKCYVYRWHTQEIYRHFEPKGLATNRRCLNDANGNQDDKWSGNFLNWATMQTVDPFRWALTGGYRVIDEASEDDKVNPIAGQEAIPQGTILEKAWASAQGGGGAANFPVRGLGNSTQIARHTPFTWSNIRIRIHGLGNKMRFTRAGDPAVVGSTVVAYNPATHDGADSDDVYELSVRVRVCDQRTGSGGVEANCTRYSNGNYKPTGLMQDYAQTFRYSVFGYLNDGSLQRDGGVLRAAQKFIGPQIPLISALPVANPEVEWNEATGVIYANPNPNDALDTTNYYQPMNGSVQNSGAINYVNKFGQLNGDISNAYKTYDPVGELFYAAVRYHKNLGNVSTWTDTASTDAATNTRRVDGFPVIRDWSTRDPIQYWCQRNAILGIGDVNTHADKNVPGGGGNQEPALPAFTDTYNAVTWTNRVGVTEGLGTSLGTQYPYNGCCNSNSALMAGTAYHANTTDIRPDGSGTLLQTKGKQTIQTFWLDVLEYQRYKLNNQFYLAAKYGGFNVPDGFDPETNTAALPDSTWWRPGQTTPVDSANGQSQKRPNNYFTAASANEMVDGLNELFKAASANLSAFTTTFATTLPQFEALGSSSYGARYDASSWTGNVQGSRFAFDANGQPALTPVWDFSLKLTAQIAGNGWDQQRRMVTWNTATQQATPFRFNNLSAAQQAALDTTYRKDASGNDVADGLDYLSYLRGDATHEEDSVATGSAKAYRKRSSPVGDIVNSTLRAVGPPAELYSDATNPGFGEFKQRFATRRTMLYVGTNAGVLHAIDGMVVDSNNTPDPNGGREVFAYVPGALYQGADGVPLNTGLMHRGRPGTSFSHRYMVDGPPVVWNIDLNRTSGVAANAAPDWRTVLIGAFGKGGRGYFALDVTNPLPDPADSSKPGNPTSLPDESAVAQRVLWEINQSQPDFAQLGFTFGEPAVVKTKKYGWVLIFVSGYNNSDGQGWFFIVNPRTGQLLEKISTGEGSPADQLGLAHVEAWLPDTTDGTADSVYAGDLKGNVWRWDLTATSGLYPAPVKIAQVTNKNNVAVPITTRPMLLVHPTLKKRFVAVGSGRLLNNTDLSSSQPQAYWAFVDGDNNGFNKPHNPAQPNALNTLPAGITFPIQRGNLVQQTDLLSPLKVAFGNPGPDPKMGWWLDLDAIAGGPNWRVIRQQSSFFGRVAFIATLPVVTDPCAPTGTSKTFFVDMGAADTQILDSAGNPVTYLLNASEALSARIYSVNNNGGGGGGEVVPKLITGDQSGGATANNTKPVTLPPLRRLNWRELQLAD
jgi:type IV pilus assembly protein PilY1